MKILSAPNKILKKKSKPVEKIDKEILQLIEKMWKILSDANGVGLAAPQIGKSMSFAIIGFEPTDKMLKENPKLKPVPKTVLINPKIVWKSPDKSVEKEGCLSCGKIEIEIPRYKKIRIEHLDQEGQKKKIRARGYLARIIQHEIDHLDGILITDYQK